MAVDLKFTKFDHTPWGFRLTGGSDYNLPLTVVKVNEGGLAECMGLQEGDILVALNDQKVGWITHDNAHDCITRAGNNFFITVLRGNYNMDELQKYAIPEAGIDPEIPHFTNDIYPCPLTNGCVNKEAQQNSFSNGLLKMAESNTVEKTTFDAKKSLDSCKSVQCFRKMSAESIEQTVKNAEVSRRQSECPKTTLDDTPETRRIFEDFKSQLSGIQESKMQTEAATKECLTEESLNEKVEELKKVLENGDEPIIDQPAALVMTKASKSFASVQPSRVTNGLQNGTDTLQNGANGLQNGTNGFQNCMNGHGIEENEDDLGKPGLTDEEIAEIISGESEVLKDQHVIGINFTKMMPVAAFLKDSEVFKALNSESIKSRAELLEEQRKYTKFLQKPNRPIPFCKRMAEITEFKEPPYKVNIKKQPKREPGSSILSEGVFLIPEVPILVPEPAPELLVAPEYLADSEFPDLEETGIPLPVKTPEAEAAPEDAPEETEAEEIKEETVAEEVEDNKPEEEKEWKDLVVDETIDENLPVEEQLAKVQKQLEALSRLPAAIQQTLDLVSKQLGKMVPKNEVTEPEKQQGNGCPENEINGESGKDEIKEKEEVGCNGVAANEENILENGKCEENSAETNGVEETKDEQNETKQICEVQEMVTENYSEEQKIQKMKQELMSELSSEQSHRQLKQRPSSATACPRRTPGPKPAFGPITPNTRPLVLPGGRKWKGPKDAFTDTFIAETLSSQASVIKGTTLGNQFESVHLPYDDRVNFMKYNKPPVVLDHIKESSVYKLVHEMDDSPSFPIQARPSRVMAESEFRERCRSATPNSMQMCQNGTNGVS